LVADPKSDPLITPENFFTDLPDPPTAQPEKSVPGVIAGEAARL
jgi:hypothetical protein